MTVRRPQPRNSQAPTARQTGRNIFSTDELKFQLVVCLRKDRSVSLFREIMKYLKGTKESSSATGIVVSDRRAHLMIRPSYCRNYVVRPGVVCGANSWLPLARILVGSFEVRHGKCCGPLENCDSPNGFHLFLQIPSDYYTV